MMEAISVPTSALPVALIEEHALSRFVYERGGEKEIRFLRNALHPLLPVWHCGELKILPWGCETGELPRTRLTWQSTVDAGEWVGAQETWVPAVAGMQGGIWFTIKQGVKAVLATKGRVSAVYLIVRPSTYYYRIMTKSNSMPVLIGETI